MDLRFLSAFPFPPQPKPPTADSGNAKKLCTGNMEDDLKMLVPLWSGGNDQYDGVRIESNKKGKRRIVIKVKSKIPTDPDSDNIETEDEDE